MVHIQKIKMDVLKIEKRRLCIILQSWLLMGQIVWMFLLCSGIQSSLSRVPCSETLKQPRVENAPLENEGAVRVHESSPNPDPAAANDAFVQLLGPSDKRMPIFEGKYDLVWIYVPSNLTVEGSSDYHGVQCSFCPVNWDNQKKEPNTVPRYGNVYDWDGCNKNELAEVKFDLADIVRVVRQYDQLPNAKSKRLEHAGFIFHESRCGSTLVANMLTVSHPDTTRVYSEPNVLLRAMKSNNKRLVEDVLYLLGRTSKSSREKRVFYKLKSDAVRHIDAMPESVPWIFLYRKPEEVMNSHFNPTEHVSGTVCLHERKKDVPNPLIEEIANEFGTPYNEMSDERFCAVRLASLCLAAIRQHERTGNGRFVNYKTLPESLWESIAPDHFGLDLSLNGIGRMKDISQVYSKGRTNNTRAWDGNELNAKLNLTTTKQEKAAHLILSSYYEKMELFSKEWM